jgi:hypothetical protein
VETAALDLCENINAFIKSSLEKNPPKDGVIFESFIHV